VVLAHPDCSKIEKEERHTRDGYKNRKKREAFAFLETVGQTMRIDQQYIERAKQMYVYPLMDCEGCVVMCHAFCADL
jgi:hypothetical protein